MQNYKLDGRLVEKPELKTTDKGTVYAKFTVASDSHMKNVDGKIRTDFIQGQIWNNRAKAFAEHHEKGSRVLLTGTIQTSEYEKEGKKVRAFSFAADDFTFVETKAQTQARVAK